MHIKEVYAPKNSVLLPEFFKCTDVCDDDSVSILFVCSRGVLFSTEKIWILNLYMIY